MRSRTEKCWEWRQDMCETVVMSDPWLRTISLLRVITSELDGDPKIEVSPSSDPNVLQRNTFSAGHFYSTREIAVLVIRILERPTQATAIVSWLEPGRCHYGCQTWKRGRATRAGTCALSQVPISRGEIVFQPRRGSICPRNSEAMILSSAMPQEEIACEE